MKKMTLSTRVERMQKAIARRQINPDTHPLLHARQAEHLETIALLVSEVNRLKSKEQMYDDIFRRAEYLSKVIDDVVALTNGEATAMYTPSMDLSGGSIGN